MWPSVRIIIEVFCKLFLDFLSFLKIESKLIDFNPSGAHIQQILKHIFSYNSGLELSRDIQDFNFNTLREGFSLAMGDLFFSSILLTVYTR